MKIKIINILIKLLKIFNYFQNASQKYEEIFNVCQKCLLMSE